MKRIVMVVLLSIPWTISNAQITKIADANFEQYLIDKGYDTGVPDGQVLTAGIDTVSKLSIGNLSISSLKGIEDFVSLTHLLCYANNLTSLDVSQNKALEYLDCYSNSLSHLDLSQNTNLKQLVCNDNNLTTLDLSQNIALERLYCIYNDLTHLDLSHNIALNWLGCGNNNLTKLDVTQNKLLTTVRCEDNALQCLNVKKDNLQFLVAKGNPNLKIITVNEPDFAEANWRKDVDEHVIFSSGEFCETGTHQITGTIQIDNKNKCQGERPLSGMVVKSSDNKYAMTDDEGNYTLYSFEENVTVSQLRMRNELYLGVTCPKEGFYQISFEDENTDTSGINFYNQVMECPLLEVNLSSNRRRRCFRNQTIIRYANNGYSDQENVQVMVDYPRYIHLISSGYSYTINEEGIYVFDIGTLAAGETGSISIIDSTACESSITGLTQCTRAWITPNNSCIQSQNDHYHEWDKSSVVVDGYCLDDTIHFSITNTGVLGEGNMMNQQEYRIYVDNQWSYTGTFRLEGEASEIIKVPANGQTIRLEADQHAMHPGRSRPRKMIEACGNGGVPIVFDMPLQAPLDNEDWNVAEQCLPIIDSYDPNDKKVSPAGVTENKYIPHGTTLNYHIRFQNTGSDTAYTVVIQDTLSSYLDVSTLQIEQSSHPVTTSLTGTGNPVLVFTFDEIDLPHLSIDEEGSNGYVSFSIAPYDTLPDGTEVHNKAAIYFDYNEPIITNDSWITLHDTVLKTSPLKVISSTVIEELSWISLYPNPTSTGQLTIDLGQRQERVDVKVYNALGQIESSEKYMQISEIQTVLGEPVGVYFVAVTTQEGVRKVFKVMKTR